MGWAAWCLKYLKLCDWNHSEPLSSGHLSTVAIEISPKTIELRKSYSIGIPRLNPARDLLMFNLENFQWNPSIVITLMNDHFYEVPAAPGFLQNWISNFYFWSHKEWPL